MSTVRRGAIFMSYLLVFSAGTRIGALGPEAGLLPLLPLLAFLVAAIFYAAATEKP